VHCSVGISGVAPRPLMKAGPCAKSVTNAMFLAQLGLASSEKQTPQINENAEEENWLLEPLESSGTRPRQALCHGRSYEDPAWDADGLLRCTIQLH